MDLKEKARRIVAGLEEAYPDALCTLGYDKPYELLIAARLAAQCTDARVNIVMRELCAKYPTIEAFAGADVSEVLEIVRPCGLGPTKARDIVAMSKILLEQYNCEVPDTLEDLLALPGVGSKIANLVLWDVFGKPAIVCDTHCIRITNLMGLTTSKNPAIVEKQLRGILEPEKSGNFCHRLVLHGRAVCVARRPDCEKCVVNTYCDYFAGHEPEHSRQA